MGKTLILNYHKILDNPTPLKKKRNGVSKADFVQQLDFLKRRNIPVMAMSDWVANPDRHDFAVILTFDNGNQSDYEVVFPILQESELKATFFPVLSFVNEKKRLNWLQLREMSGYGYEIGSHSVFHKSIKRAGVESCKFELEVSKRILEQQIGTQVRFFAPPYGVYNRRMLKLAVRAGYEKIFSTRLKMNYDAGAFIHHRWNVSPQTSIETFEQVIQKGLLLHKEHGWLPKLKYQISKKIETGLIDLTNELLLKLDKHSF